MPINVLASLAVFLVAVQGSEVTIRLDSLAPYYEPVVAHAPVGVSVIWANPTASPHTVRHDGCVVGPSCAFDSGPIRPDGRYVLKDMPPGEYPYHCELHPIMRGTLVVTAGSDPAGSSRDTLVTPGRRAVGGSRTGLAHL